MEKNIEEYGRSVNPMFPIHNIDLSNVPIYLFGGDDDLYSAPEDVEWISTTLSNVKNYTSYPGFDHYTFTGMPENALHL